MKNLILITALLICLTPVNTFAALNPNIYDYGFFGVSTENPKSSILWAEYPNNTKQWESVQIESDGRYIVRLYDEKGGIIIQNIQENNQELDLSQYKAHGIQLQLSKTTGSYARFVTARTSNPLSPTVNFLENPDEF